MFYLFFFNPYIDPAWESNIRQKIVSYCFDGLDILELFQVFQQLS